MKSVWDKYIDEQGMGSVAWRDSHIRIVGALLYFQTNIMIDNRPIIAYSL